MYRRGGNLPPATFRYLSRVIKRCNVGRIRCSGGNLPPPGPEGRNRGTFTFVTAKPETSVIPTAASAEWRNLLRCRKVPPQGKICHLGRFLDSLRSLGMTCRGEAPFIQTGCIRNVAGRFEKWNYIGRGPPGRRGWLWRYKQAPKCRLFRCLGARAFML